MPCRQDASVNRWLVLEGLMWFISAGLRRTAFVLAIAAECSESHNHAVSFFDSILNGVVTCVRSGMNFPSWLARPRNYLSFMMSSGSGNS